MRLEWISALSIDGGEVDRQHQFLFDLYNQIVDVPEGQVDKALILGSLRHYASYHFQDEESLMASIHYPEPLIRRHKADHARFLRELERLEGKPVYLTLDYFREWLLRHIMSEDYKIHTFLEQNPKS